VRKAVTQPGAAATMKTAYKVILVNLGTLVGCGIVALTLPPDTSAALFGSICLFTLIVMNSAIIIWPRFRKSRGVDQPSSKSTTAKVIAILVIFIVGLIVNWVMWHHR
jgi:amino acid transporter